MLRPSMNLCARCWRNSKLYDRYTLLPPPFPPSPIRSRQYLQTQQFQPFAPPPPESLPKPSPIRHYPRTRRWARRLIYLSIGATGIYTIDRNFYSACLTRTLRTFGVGLVVALDYKINFRARPLFVESLAALHTRNAERLFNVLSSNGGLYLKMGQAIAMQSAVLPPEFQKMFAKMFDDAPQNTWAEVERVIREDFGKSPEEVFGVSFTGEAGKGVMEKTARASASIAQVHWARLQDGREVAIKIQKRDIARQVGWDLWSFQVVTRIYSWWFDIPLASMIPFVNERLLLETNFVNEADNAERMAKLIAGESRLRGRAYIPRVYRELSSERVMTAEWIEGVSLWNKEGLTKPWRGGRGVGSPGCQGTPLDQSNPKQLSETSVATPAGSPSKPNRDWWKGPDGLGGLGLSLKEVMTIMVDIFSAQMFLWGWVHCDPHPGNIFIRRLPSGKPELVLIDHGLYVHLEPTFRHEYSLFWKSLMTFDNTAVGEIAQKWGAQNADIFASATLMRPYTGGDHSTSTSLTSPLSGTEASERAYEMQQKMRKAMRQILADESKFPKPLLFLGRNLRIVQGNNQFLGSPVNRIKITGWWASRSLAESSDLPWRTKLRNLGRHVLFTLVMWSSDLVFWGSRLRQVLGWGRRGGMEEEIEERMKVMMKDFGVELNHAVFEG